MSCQSTCLSCRVFLRRSGVSLDDVPLLTTAIVIRSNPAAPSSLTSLVKGVKYKCRLCTNLRSLPRPATGLHFTWESTFVNRLVLVREFSRAFAVDPVFSLELIAGQPAVNVWPTSEEQLVLLNCSSMLSCSFSVLRVQIATNMHELRDRENCCVSERQKDQHTLDHVLAPRISMAHVKWRSTKQLHASY